MKPQPAPAVDNKALPDEIMAIMEELAAVMAEEVVLLPKNDIKAHQLLLQKKNALRLSYETKMKALFMQPAVLKSAPESVRAKLKAAGMKLAQATEKNALAIRTAAQCSERLINHIMRHVKDKAVPKFGYADPRKAKLKLGAYSPKSTPVAVNRTA